MAFLVVPCQSPPQRLVKDLSKTQSFSASKALPLLREALTAGLVSSLPNLGDDDYQEGQARGHFATLNLKPSSEVLVYDLGEYLAPGLFPLPAAVAWQQILFTLSKQQRCKWLWARGRYLSNRQSSFTVAGRIWTSQVDGWMQRLRRPSFRWLRRFLRPKAIDK